ncbi:hypothetical protein [Tumebacillus lipolyticus]|uniref:Uncharacterized protein n=1 Tax=Tumebacillus lipolyticus TaxID=1280370 RepID=A0ABW4ZYU5_9BACL
MLEKFSNLIGVNQASKIEPEVLVDCRADRRCTDVTMEATFHILPNGTWVFQHCGCY